MSAPLVSGVLALVLMGFPASSAAQVQTSSKERFFRVEWRIEGAGDAGRRW
jgi:hypothetical protein